MRLRHFVFPSSKTQGQIKEVKKGLAGACKQAGNLYGQTVLGGITFHTFCHWFSSRLEDLGVSKTVRRDLLGHEPKDMSIRIGRSLATVRFRTSRLRNPNNLQSNAHARKHSAYSTFDGRTHNGGPSC